jgi:Right handed beta helix region
LGTNRPLRVGWLLLAGLLAGVLALMPARAAFGAVHDGSTYYVSADGNDSNDGRSPQTAWQTLAEVATVALQPGDSILLRGGDTFSGPLKTAGSGTAGAPILFASYGSGRARIVGPTSAAAVYLNSNRFLSFSGLDLTAPRADCVLVSGSGTGSSDIAFDQLTIHDCGGAGLNADNPGDARIALTRSTVENTQGCGVFFRGTAFDVSDNEISNTGINASGALTFPLHGIYAKGPAPVITDNTIRDFQTAAITIRSTGSDVERNRIEARTRGQRGISYYQETAARGTTRIVGNTIAGVSVQGIAIDKGSTTAEFGGGPTTASTSESFVIARNDVTMHSRSGRVTVEGIRLLRVPSAVVIRNHVGGRATHLLTVYAPRSSYRERSNVWQTNAARQTFSWNGASMSFAAYATSSGQGARDSLFH